MRFLLLALSALPDAVLAGFQLCSSHKTCEDCARACDWCPHDGQCHSATFFNYIDPCRSTKTDIISPSKCPGKPKPPPTPPPVPPPVTDSTFAKNVMTIVLKKMGIAHVDVDGCVKDIGDTERRFRDFGFDVQKKKHKSALEELGRGMSALAHSVSDCKVQDVQQKLDALAAAVKWAKVSTSALDRGVAVLVGASDLWKDFAAMAQAVQAEDPDSIGDALHTLLHDWTAIEGGCQPNQTACQVVDGLLKVIATTAKAVTPCERALQPAIDDFLHGGQLFKSKDYKNATLRFAAGLDILAKATSSDACELKGIADTIGSLSPKLEAAAVKIEGSSAVKVIVGSADVYDELYMLAEGFEKKDYGGVGVQLGLLLAKLKASGCQTSMCILVEGLTASLQVGFKDLDACSADLDKAWSKMQGFLSSIEHKDWKQAVLSLGDAVKAIADGVNACGVPEIGKILQDTALKLHQDSLAAEIGEAMQFLARGTDITGDIGSIVVDATNENWAALGKDLGTLSAWLGSTTCHTFTCKLMEGILQEADLFLSDLKPCEDQLRVAETDFVTGATLWGQKDHGGAITSLSAGLNTLAKAVNACGLPEQLKYIEQEANVLGLGNVTSVDKGLSILVHGGDLVEEITAAWAAFAKHDYRAAGSELQKAVDGLFQWTTGHLCTSDTCYLLSGILQYATALGKDIKKCGADWKDLIGQFHAAYDELAGAGGFSTTNFKAIQKGVRDMGKGVQDLADNVGDCHLEELAAILNKLAVQLGIAPEVAVEMNVLKIVIDGVHIERQIAAGLEQFSTKNWPGFGYNIMELVMTLMGTGAGVQKAPKANIII